MAESKLSLTSPFPIHIHYGFIVQPTKTGRLIHIVKYSVSILLMSSGL